MPPRSGSTMNTPEAGCSHVVEIEHEPRHHLMVANEWVRAFAVDIPAGDRTLCHHHPHDYYVYVTGPAEITSTRREEEAKRLSYNGGEVEASSAGMVHVVENLGETAFRNVVVEVVADRLPGGSRLRATAGEAVFSRAYSDERVTISVIGVQSVTEIEVLGPAIVASPWGASLTLTTEGMSRRLSEFRDLAWIAPRAHALVSAMELNVTRALIFQIGVVGG